MSRFAWPFPKDLPLLDLLALTQRWKTALAGRQLGPRSETFDRSLIDKLGQTFLELVIRTVRGQPSPPAGAAPWSWSEIGRQIVELSEISGVLSRREEAGKVWAFRRAGLLAAPESGLSPAEAKAWLEVLRDEVKKSLGEKRWRDFQAALRDERKLRAEVVVKERGVSEFKVETLLANIDEKFGDHAWIAEMNAVTSGAIGSIVQADPIAMAGKATVSIGPMTAKATESGKEEKSALHELKKILTDLSPGYPMDKVNRMPEHHIEVLADIATQFKGLNVDGIEVKAFTAIWRKATEICNKPELVSVVSAVGGELRVAPALLRSPVPEEAANRVHPRDLVRDNVMKDALWLTPRDNASVVAWQMQDPILFGEGPDSQTLGGLYQIIWDFKVRRWPQTAQRLLFFLEYWPALTVGVPELDRGISWPSFPWLTFRQLEQVITSWNAAVQDVKSLGSVESLVRVGDEAADQENVDALAFWMASTSGEIKDPDRVTKSRVRVAPTIADWRMCVSDVNTTAASQPQALAAHTRRWLADLLLFAAPESALSVTAAEGILQGLIGVPLEVLSEPVAVREMRQKRLDVEPGKAEAILRNIDAATPDNHPFLRRFPRVTT